MLQDFSPPWYLAKVCFLDWCGLKFFAIQLYLVTKVTVVPFFFQHPMKYSSLNGKLYGLSKDYGSDTKWFCFLKPTWQQKMLCIFQRERCLMRMSYNGDLDNDQMVLLLNLDLFLTAVRKVRPAHQAPVC